jgi:hypothetical protein
LVGVAWARRSHEFMRPTVRQARVTRIARIKIKPRISRSYFHDNPPCPYRSYVTSRDLFSSVIPFRAIRGFVLIRAIRVILTKAIPTDGAAFGASSIYSDLSSNVRHSIRLLLSVA